MQFNIKPNIVALVVSVALLAVTFWGGYSYGKAQVPSQFLVEGVTNQTVGQPNNVDFSLFWDAWRVIETEYVDKDNLDREEMVFGAIEGMVRALGDPYTTFFKPEDEKMFREDISGSFEGIGAEIGIRDDTITIISPLEGSPAQQAGLRAGDRVVGIDDTSTQGMSLNEAVQLIRGEGGTTVILTVARNGTTQEISIVRDTIRVPVISWENREGVAYVRLFSFSATSPTEFARVMGEVRAAGLERMVLDLRNNPGGFLEAAQRIAGWFVEPGETVAIESFGDLEREDELYRAVGSGAMRDVALVVLVNEGSASASEIIAGALRDLRDTPIVGTQTFGKGSVQELESLRKGAIKVTVAKWLTPNGTSISDEGIEPNIVVEIEDPEELEPEEDPQLERALEVVRGL